MFRSRSNDASAMKGTVEPSRSNDRYWKLAVSPGGNGSFHRILHRQPDRGGVLPVGDAIVWLGDGVLAVVDLGPVRMVELMEGETGLQGVVEAHGVHRSE